MSSHRFLAAALSLAFLASMVLGSCNMPAASTGTAVWLDVPVDGLTFPAPQAIKIEGHASGAGGISRVEISIDGAVLTTIDDPALEGDLAAFHTAWTPPAEGTYTIQAVAYASDGSASAPDTARVTFGGATPTPTTVVGCPSPVGGGPTPPPPCPTLPMACPSPVGGGPTPVTCTEEPPPTITVTTPASEVQFWADPESITAGACTNLRWHAANVQAVAFGGVAQPLDGSYEACLCDDERYTLTVTHLDGTEERLTVDIPVEGECVTEVPSDTTAPPAPEPAVPANGLNVACKGSQTLAWLPVDDASGIAEYRVALQRHSGDANWKAAPGSPFTGIAGKQIAVDVECGWYYRWRVRAVDGVGNEGDFSDWSEFTITLE